jgi:hypothetical protein
LQRNHSKKEVSSGPRQFVQWEPEETNENQYFFCFFSADDRLTLPVISLSVVPWPSVWEEPKPMVEGSFFTRLLISITSFLLYLDSQFLFSASLFFAGKLYL